MNQSKLENNNIFVTSRPNQDTGDGLEDPPKITVEASQSIVDQGISGHIRSCLSQDTRLKKRRQSIKEEMEIELSKQSKGIQVYLKSWEMLSCVETNKDRFRQVVCP